MKKMILAVAMLLTAAGIAGMQGDVTILGSDSTIMPGQVIPQGQTRPYCLGNAPNCTVRLNIAG